MNRSILQPCQNHKCPVSMDYVGDMALHAWRWFHKQKPPPRSWMGWICNPCMICRVWFIVSYCKSYWNITGVEDEYIRCRRHVYRYKCGQNPYSHNISSMYFINERRNMIYIFRGIIKVQPQVSVIWNQPFHLNPCVFNPETQNIAKRQCCAFL